jgi:hypothetical protein
VQFKYKIIVVTSLILVACGGGGGGGNASSLEVPAPNTAPTITGSISEIRVGESLNFQPSASDLNGDSLTYNITGAPEWASFNATSGLLTGKPTSEDLGSTYAISISVSDGQLSSSISFNLTVVKPLFRLNIEVSSMADHMNMAIIFSA